MELVHGVVCGANSTEGANFFGFQTPIELDQAPPATAETPMVAGSPFRAEMDNGLAYFIIFPYRFVSFHI